MQLNWTHNKAERLLKCVVFHSETFNQTLYYTTTDGGTTINKYFNDVLINTYVRTPEQDPWEDEKQWLSETYSEHVGVYRPMWHLQELSEEESKKSSSTFSPRNEDAETYQTPTPQATMLYRVLISIGRQDAELEMS